MNKQEILKHFRKGDKKRKLTNEEVSEIVSKIKCHLPLKRKALEFVNVKFEYLVRKLVSNLSIYGCMIPVFIQKLYLTFINSLESPGNPLGVRTADAMSQQAMQDLLDSFHNTGAAKPGGIEGITDCISLPDVRKNTFMTLHFSNEYLTEKQVLDMKYLFVNMNVGSFCDSIKTIEVNIRDQINDKRNPKNKQEAIDLFNSGCLWWYKHSDISLSRVYKETIKEVENDNSIETEIVGVNRICIRLELNLVKLLSVGKTTTDIANCISTINIPVILGKKKDDQSNYTLYCVPSPTFMGIIDVYIGIKHENEDNEDEEDIEPNENDIDKDYFMETLVKLGAFSKLYVSGIPDIINFFPIPYDVTNRFFSVERAYDIVNGEQVQIGTWLYIKKSRYDYVPMSRILHIFNKLGINILYSSKTINVDNFDFNAHKILEDRRKKICVDYYVEDINSIARKYTYKGEEIILTTNLFSIEKTELLEETFKIFTASNVEDMKLKGELNNFEEFKLSSSKEYTTVLDSLLDEKHKKHNKHLEKFFSATDEKQVILLKLKDKESGEKKKIYVIRVKLTKYRSYLNVNLDELNKPSNYYSLKTIVISHFCIKNLKFPSTIRIPTFKVVEKIELIKIFEKKRAILLNTCLPFRKNIDITLDDTEESIKKKQEEMNKKSPLDILISFIKSNLSEDDYTYIYAETKGSNFKEISKLPAIKPTKIMTNSFSEVCTYLGYEALRNLIVYDLNKIVSMSGYLNKKYIRLIGDMETCNNKNKLTSEGIKNQSTGPISLMCFDNLKTNVSKFSSYGNKYPMATASTGVLVNGRISSGTGYVKIFKDKFSMSEDSVKPENDISNLKFNVDNSSEVINRYLIIRHSKFPSVQKILDDCIVKSIGFYLNLATERFKHARVNEIFINLSTKDFRSVPMVQPERMSVQDLYCS